MSEEKYCVKCGRKLPKPTTSICPYCGGKQFVKRKRKAHREIHHAMPSGEEVKL